MEIQDFQNLDIIEYNLEVTLNALDEEGEGDVTCMHIGWIKKQVLAGKTELTRIHPLIPQAFSYEDGNIRIFPYVTPTTEIDAIIESYKPIFGGDPCLVLAKTKGNSFIFFDPDSRNKDYQERISKLSRIKISSIGSDSAIPVDDPEEYKGYPDCWRGWRPCLYEAVFTISKELERVDNYVRLEVNNPFDKTKTLEMLTNYAHFETKQEKIFHTNFFVTGTII